jgi:hypothetical protein
LRRQGVFAPGKVTALIEEHLEHRRDNRMVLWALLVFQLWYDKYTPGTVASCSRELVGSAT